MWRNRSITLDQYADLCSKSAVSASYSPEVVHYYYASLGLKPKLVGVRYRHGSLVAAFPSLYRMVFPTALHKRLLGRSAARLGDFGQPESLFPVLPGAERIALNHFSPITSALLAGRLRTFGKRSLRRIAVAKERKHKKLSARARAFVEEGGRAHFSEDMSPGDFADAYVELFCRRWGYAPDDMKPVRQQIHSLYSHLHCVLLTMNGTPVAAQLCCKHAGPSLYYVDFINSGVQKTDDNAVSFGSVMMLLSLRRCEEQAKALGRPLRFSFGFSYSDRDYKAVWADPEPTFMAI